MTVFKTFLKILNKNKWILLLYTAILVLFGTLNFQDQQNTMNFTSSKPDIAIVNLDTDNRWTKNLIQYLEKNTNIIEIEDREEARSDALFYREINLSITIPENYGTDVLNGKNPKLEYKSTGDYQSSLAEILLNRYLKIATTYLEFDNNPNSLIEKINETLSKETTIEKTTTLDSNILNKSTSFYNFANYSMLAGCIYMICLILSSFKEEKVLKRTMISKKNYKKLNRELFLSNSLFAFSLSFIYIILSIILIGSSMRSIHGLLYIINFLFFTICALGIAFFIGNIVKNKEAINGIINVIALGSSFLCGAFVPAEYLPNFVLKIAHILPSYYFINNNEVIKTLEKINIETILPFLENIMIMMLFTIFFVFMTNLASKKQQRIN